MAHYDPTWLKALVPVALFALRWACIRAGLCAPASVSDKVRTHQPPATKG